MLPLAVLTRMLFLEEFRLWLPSSSENAADSGFLSCRLGTPKNPLPAPLNNRVNDDGAVWHVPRLACLSSRNEVSSPLSRMRPFQGCKSWGDRGAQGCHHAQHL